MTSFVLGTPAPLESGWFGEGPQEPYEHALRRGRGVLNLSDATGLGPHPPTGIDVSRFVEDASESERHLVHELEGPILDVGCGPGRLVKASIMAGHLALGVDTSAAAIELARAGGLPVLRRSVFNPLPNEGQWGAALLIDGNIGIGGEPHTLLRRCAQLVHASGRVVVEAHGDADWDRTFSGVITDGSGRSSLAFPWAEVGTAALRRHAQRAGLTLVREWSEQHRCFAVYAPR